MKKLFEPPELLNKKPQDQEFKEFHSVTLDKKISEFDQAKQELKQRIRLLSSLIQKHNEFVTGTDDENSLRAIQPVLLALKEKHEAAKRQKQQLKEIRENIERDREALRIQIKAIDLVQEAGQVLENDGQAQITATAQTAEATVHALRTSFDEAFKLSANALANIEDIPFESIEPVLADGVEKDKELTELLDHIGKELATE